MPARGGVGGASGDGGRRRRRRLRGEAVVTVVAHVWRGRGGWTVATKLKETKRREASWIPSKFTVTGRNQRNVTVKPSIKCQDASNMKISACTHTQK